jgi:hypothetical protein
MAIEHHHAEDVPGRLADRGDPAPPRIAEWGWLLVQRDWSLRQREPRPDGVVVTLRRRVVAAAAWLRRLICGAPRRVVQAMRVAAGVTSGGGGPGTGQSSGRRS